MSDPYQVLGVSPSATDEEVTKAYRKLAKKYHPDINPGPDAEKKMQQINAAYEQIQQMRKNGGASAQRGGGYQQQSQNQQRQQGGYSYSNSWDSQGDPFEGFDPFGFGFGFGTGGQRRQQNRQDFTDVKFRAVHNYVQNGCWQEALNVLSEITDRNAQWYYYSAVVNGQLGNRITAMNHAQEAARREPGNRNYQELVNRYQQGNFTYYQAQEDRGFTVFHAGNPLCTCCAAYALCQCCCMGSMGGGYMPYH